MSNSLDARIASMVAVPVARQVREFAAWLASGTDARIVLFYGSNLRTGSLEGVLDFYVLQEGPKERGIWPHVSYHEKDFDGRMLRAKVATMHLETFREAAAGRLLDTTIWARFVQPSTIAWYADENAKHQVENAIAVATMTAARLASVLGPRSGTPEDYWRTLFRATYAAELRIERAGRADSILAANTDHFSGLLPLALEADGFACIITDGNLSPVITPARRRSIRNWWRLRRLLSKPYNLARLIKATVTFAGAARYAAWKLERHSGVAVKLTPWRERHPVLGVTAMVWQVWRTLAARS